MSKRRPQYQRWYNINQRCHNTNDRAYHNYGGRGISNYWRYDRAGFAAYIDEHLGVCPPGHSLDRIDTNGNYEPGNLRWATYSTQITNRRPYKRSERNMIGGESGYKWVYPINSGYRGIYKTNYTSVYPNPADAYLQVLALRSFLLIQ